MSGYYGGFSRGIGGWEGIADADAVLAYLRKAVINTCRSHARRSVILGRVMLQRGTHTGTIEDHAVDVWRGTAIHRALRQLPTRQREAVVLRFYVDLSDRQIAEIMGITPSGVRATVSRAQHALADLLKGEIDGRTS